ncbi:hypothetical protein FBY31_0739 [Arthrobacter sp. SLBN-100]|nr:hypothetical protein FBY31_0739 [Arthrobacter sp. SLBN-100]
MSVDDEGGALLGYKTRITDDEGYVLLEACKVSPIDAGTVDGSPKRC